MLLYFCNEYDAMNMMTMMDYNGDEGDGDDDGEDDGDDKVKEMDGRTSRE